MPNRGFTLMELLIAVSLLTVIGALSMVAIQTSTQSMTTASAKAQLLDELRETMNAVTQELQHAAKTANPALAPPLQAVTVTENPVAGSPVQIAYQIPRDATGRNWSRPIILRHINEDLNGNGILDPGEDTNGDGVLTRRLIRLEDVDGDGNISPSTEIRPVGNANNLTNVQFVRNGDIITITLTAEKRVPPGSGATVTATTVGRVYLMN